MDTEREACDQVLAALRRIIRAIDLHSRKLAQRYGLTGPQLIILKELQSLGDVSVGELAKRISLSSGTVTDILERLEKRGLVQRARSNADRRRVLNRITEKGEEILQKAPTLLQERFVEEFEKIQDWEQTLILSSLQRVASLMEIEETLSRPVLVTGPLAATVEETVEFLAEPDSVAQSPEHSPRHPPRT